MKAAILCLLFAAIHHSCSGTVSFSTDDGEMLRNVLLSEPGSLILGSTVKLRRLDQNLEVQQTVNLEAEEVSRLLTSDPGGTASDSFMSCGRMNCRLLDRDDLTSQEWEGENVLLNGVLNADGLFVTGPFGQTVFTAALRNEAQPSAIVRGNLTGVGTSGLQSFGIYARQDEMDSFTPREFLSVFETDEFSYFVNRLTIDGENQIRLVRVCNNDTGQHGTVGFASYFEIQLQCGEGATYPTAATFSPNDAKMFVSVSSATENFVCTYDLSVIHAMMTDKYDDCRAGIGQAGLARARSRPKPCEPFEDERLNNSIITECNLVSDLLPSQEVATPLSSSPILTQPLSGTNFSSLLHTSLDGVQFIFAGTFNGSLYQYYINGGAANIVHKFDLVNSEMTNISQLVVTSDGLTLYALSPHELISHSVDVCDSYKTCDSCLGEERDPICGWCALENRCSREINCNADSPVWVSDSMGSCPDISSVDPSIVYLKELEMGSVNITLTTANIPDNDITYDCQFNFHRSTAKQNTGNPPDISMETMSSMATRDGNSFTCRVPTGIPGIPNMEDALLSDLSLHYDNNDVAVLETPLRFANCSVHTKCTSCIESNNQCRWCPFTFKCIASRNEVCGGSETSTTSCPQLLPDETNSGDYFIHTNYDYGNSPLVIRAKNLEEFRDRFEGGEFDCVIRNGSTPLFQSPAVLLSNGDSDMIRCEKMKYVLDEGVSRLEATLEVEWNQNGQSIDNPDKTGVIFYRCPKLGSNCAECLSLDDDYRCNYCGFSCSLDNQCTREGSESIMRIEKCDLPIITSISPNSGPREGGTMVTVTGTNLGKARSELLNVTIDGVVCVVIDQSYQPGVSFQCETGGLATSGSYSLQVNFSYLSKLVESLPLFTFKTPSLSFVSPQIGPQAGGTMVTITGNNLDVGSKVNVELAGRKCSMIYRDRDDVTCFSSSSDEPTRGVVLVAINNWSAVVNDVVYEYASNPTITRISPNFSFSSGGTSYVIEGTNLHIVQEPRLLIHITSTQRRRRRRQTVTIIESQICIPDGVGNTLTCEAPPISPPPSDRQTVGYGLEMDGVQQLRLIDEETLAVYSDPRFQPFGHRSFSRGEEIRLTIQSTGSEFVFTPDMLEVLITPCSRDQCVCVDVTFQSGNTSFSCIVEGTGGLTRGSELTVRVHIGFFNQSVGRIEITEPINFVVIIVPIAVLFVLGMVIFAVVIFIFYYKSRQKDSRYKELIVEMEKLESSVARECKLGFAELQTDLDELTGDVSGQRLPYHNLKVYLMAGLFPGFKDHPVLHPVQLPLQRQISSQRAIKDFHDLCMDKKVLLIFIRTLEEQRSFTIRDKSLVGSLLMVALHNRLDYATGILKTLLSDLIHRAVHKSAPKLLLRRTESVAEKMLTNWLAFCLHGYIVEQTGKPLYLLYRAVKSQLEKGPIDVITGEARYSLSEHKLIRQKMEVEVLMITVEADDGLRIPVKVLDCDTISQVKEKLLDIVYKTIPVSRRPALSTIDLQYVKSPHDHQLLRDVDATTVIEGGWKRLNTLNHYRVEDGAAFRLMKRLSYAPPGQSFDYPASLISSHAIRNRALSEAEDGTRVWHLFKQHDTEDPKHSPFMNKKMITEVYLPRMLSTKNILQKFVDDLFSSVFSVTLSPTSPVTYSNFFPGSPGTMTPVGYAPGGTVPMAVKYLLDFLDDAAESHQISERDVVHTWKNNALALRFWVTVMKNPEFVFDINKSHTVDACLSVIAQALIDGCSFSDIKLTIDSPTSKLLYNKDVQEYKTKVRQYYESVARLPRIPEDVMQSFLKQLSEHQTQVFKKNGGFVVESALYELLRYGNKYSEQLLMNLRAAGLDSRAQVFESISRATK